jgi:hypothetical protein
MSDLKDIAIATATARQVLTGVREGIAWFRDRGLARDKLIEMLDACEAEGRDLTDIEYAQLAGTAQDAINRLLAASDAAAAPVVVPEPVVPLGGLPTSDARHLGSLPTSDARHPRR